MKKIIILFICAFFAHKLAAQEVIWEQFYTEPYPRIIGFKPALSQHEGNTISLTKDGNLLWATRASAWVTVLYKLDKTGNEIWKNIFLNQDIEPIFLSRTTESSYFYEREDGLLASGGNVGMSLSGAVPYQQLLDQNGKELWRYPNYETAPSSEVYSYSKYVSFLPSEKELRIVLMSEEIKFDGDIDYYVVDTNSRILKNKKFNSGKLRNRPEAIIRLQNGSILILASYLSERGNEIGAMGCLSIKDDDSTVIYAKAYQDTINATYPRSVVQAKNGDLVFCGYSLDSTQQSYQPFVLRTDDTMGIRWQKILSIKGGNCFPKKIVETEDGGFVIVGDIGSVSGKLMLIRTDKNGELLWSKTWGGNYTLTEGLADVLINKDRSITVSGTYAFDDTSKNVTAYIANIRDGAYRDVPLATNSEAKFSISPNPMQEEGFLEYKLLAESEKLNAELYNVSGEKIKTIFSGVISGRLGRIKFGTSELSSGVYYIKLKAGDKTELKQFVIAR